MADRIKAIAIDEVNRIRRLAYDGLRSGAYMYPFKGLAYFLSHRSLWGPMLSKIGPAVSLGLLVTSSMFLFTYIPQVALLAFTSGPLAPFSAALLVLTESSTILNFISRGLLLEESLVDTFDGTLIAQGHTALVAAARQVKADAGSGPVSRLGRAVRKPLERLSPAYLVRSLMYLPLNFIPVVGTFMYIATQGKRIGPLAHARYYQLKGWNAKQKDEWVASHRAAYTSFGAAAFALEMVPFASLAFAYTNTVGAALWASKMELETPSFALGDQGKKGK